MEVLRLPAAIEANRARRAREICWSRRPGGHEVSVRRLLRPHSPDGPTAAQPWSGPHEGMGFRRQHRRSSLDRNTQITGMGESNGGITSPQFLWSVGPTSNRTSWFLIPFCSTIRFLWKTGSAPSMIHRSPWCERLSENRRCPLVVAPDTGLGLIPSKAPTCTLTKHSKIIGLEMLDDPHAKESAMADALTALTKAVRRLSSSPKSRAV